jgi:ABC-type microcin C transport system permease subunit YejE
MFLYEGVRFLTPLIHIRKGTVEPYYGHPSITSKVSRTLELAVVVAAVPKVYFLMIDSYILQMGMRITLKVTVPYTHSLI